METDKEKYDKGDSDKNESPLRPYNIEDDDPYGEYVIEDEEEGEPDFQEQPPKREFDGQKSSLPGAFSLFFKIMINPVSGWKELRKSKISAVELVVRLLIPMCIVAGLSHYTLLIYDPIATVGMTSVRVVVTFFTFYISYYLAGFASWLLLPKVNKDFPSSRYGEMMVNICISSLAFFHILSQVFWFLDTLLVFLPLWTIYLIFKGMGFVKMSESRSTYTLGVECVVILCSPLVLEWVFSFIV